MELKVKTRALVNTTYKIMRSDLVLQGAIYTIENAANSLSGESYSYNKVIDSLRKCESAVRSDHAAVRTMRSSLSKIAGEYTRTEKNIVSEKVKIGFNYNMMRFPAIRIPRIGIRSPFLWNPIAPIIIGGVATPIGSAIGLIPSIIGPLTGYIRRNANPSIYSESNLKFDKNNLGVNADGKAGITYFKRGDKYQKNNSSAGYELKAGSAEATYGASASLMRDGEFNPNAAAYAGVEIAGVAFNAAAQSGLFSGEVEAKVGHIAARGEVTASLFDKNGKLSPSLEAKASTEATLAEGKVKYKVGNDKINYKGEAEGKLMTAGAKAEAKITKDSAKVEVGAEAYAAKGSVQGEWNLFGLKIGAKASGGVGGAAAVAGGEVTGSSVKGKIGLGLLFGVELEFNIEW